MMLAADLHTAIVTAWNAATLNTQFKAYWTTPRPSDFVVLHDQMASPAQPFPYCVFTQDEGATSGRMTGHNNAQKSRFETRDIPFEFRIYARAFTGINKSAKQIASELAEEVLKIFGGHPTVEPVELTLENGHVLLSTYVTDFGIRQGDQEHCWHVKYTFKLDVPVAA